jgi:RimJ/RimL family protein N-acetyltransferase
MILKENLIGKNILLRTAREDDAEFILGLRLNPRLNQYLKKTDPSLEKQRSWIAQKQKQENDYHMIIDGLSGKSWGVIALYAVDPEKKTFDWGRWIVAEDAPFSVSIESAILLYKFAFDDLQLERALYEVQKANLKVINFHKRFGAKVRGEDEKFLYFVFDREAFDKAMVRYKKYHDFN